MKQMWRNIRNSWDYMKDETECDIMRRYSCIGEFTTIFMIRMRIFIYTIDSIECTCDHFSHVISTLLTALGIIKIINIINSHLSSFFINSVILDIFWILCLIIQSVVMSLHLNIRRIFFRNHFLKHATEVTESI